MRDGAALAAVPSLERRSRQQSLFRIVAYIAVPTVKVLIEKQMYLPTSHTPRFYAKNECPVYLRSNRDHDPVMLSRLTRIEKFERVAVARTSDHGVERFLVWSVIHRNHQTLKVCGYWHHFGIPSPRNNHLSDDNRPKGASADVPRTLLSGIVAHG